MHRHWLPTNSRKSAAPWSSVINCNQFNYLESVDAPIANNWLTHPRPLPVSLMLICTQAWLNILWRPQLKRYIQWGVKWIRDPLTTVTHCFDILSLAERRSPLYLPFEIYPPARWCWFEFGRWVVDARRKPTGNNTSFTRSVYPTVVLRNWFKRNILQLSNV